jgi:hypothetical protein
VNFERPESSRSTGKNAAAIALVACGLFTLIIQFLMAPTHTIAGINYADVWHTALSVIGGLLILTGIGIFIRTNLASAKVRKQAYN